MAVHSNYPAADAEEGVFGPQEAQLQEWVSSLVSYVNVGLSEKKIPQAEEVQEQVVKGDW